MVRPGSAPVLLHGILFADDFGLVHWYYWDGAVREVTLGRTAERPKKPDPRMYGYRDADVVVDSDGVAHVVFAVESGKTAYVKVGEKGSILARTEVAGKKALARSGKKVVLVDRPLRPAKRLPGAKR